MLDISSNFPNKYSSKNCPVCKDETTLDTQAHLLICPQLTNDQQLTQNIPKYEDLFSGEIEKQIQVASIIQENFKKRKMKLKNRKTSSLEEPSEPEVPSSVLQ